MVSELIYYGGVVRPQKIAWHGSQITGERSPQLYCNAWESSSPDKLGLASSLLGERLLQQLQFSCNHSFAVLCIEVSSNTRRHVLYTVPN